LEEGKFEKIKRAYKCVWIWYDLFENIINFFNFYTSSFLISIDQQWSIQQKRRLYRGHPTVHQTVQCAAGQEAAIRRGHRHIVRHLRLFPFQSKGTRFR